MVVRKSDLCREKVLLSNGVLCMDAEDNRARRPWLYRPEVHQQVGGVVLRRNLVDAAGAVRRVAEHENVRARPLLEPRTHRQRVLQQVVRELQRHPLLLVVHDRPRNVGQLIELLHIPIAATT